MQSKSVRQTKAEKLRDKAEELRVNADNISAIECKRINLEVATVCDELAAQYEMIEVLGWRAVQPK